MSLSKLMPSTQGREKPKQRQEKNACDRNKSKDSTGQTNSNSNNSKNANNRKKNNTKTGTAENQNLTGCPVRLLAKLSTLQGNATLKPIEQRDRLLGNEDRWDRARINNKTLRTSQTKVSRLQLKI